jgi:hypothetical protein
MPNEQILALLRVERDRLNRAIEALGMERVDPKTRTVAAFGAMPASIAGVTRSQP